MAPWANPGSPTLSTDPQHPLRVFLCLPTTQCVSLQPLQPLQRSRAGKISIPTGPDACPALTGMQLL